MTGRIFRSTLAASLTVLLASLLVITGCLYSYFGTVQERQLREELSFAAAAVEADGDDYLARLRSTASRLTWVAADGTVLYDTQADAAAMENHAGRQEIREALTGGSGSSVRYSSTLTEKNVSAVAYSTVYPLAMFLRILSGQFVLLILWQFVS